MNMIWPSERELDALFRRHHGDPMSQGWRVRMCHRFGYQPAERWYEAVVDQLVTPGCRWIDVGGGRSVLPHNPLLSQELAGRCGWLVGVDPSDNTYENTVVHQQVHSTIEDFHSQSPFDLATLRMVAEHIAAPKQAVESLQRLIRPGGHVVIYTPSRWSLFSIAAGLIPNAWHRFFTHVLWNTRPEDVFPTFYRMNTRKRLRALFDSGGFAEVAFHHVPSCGLFPRFRLTCFGELCLWRVLRWLRIAYPANNLLGIYRRL